MGETIPPAAKGLYTFTTVEKIAYRRAVVASSWDEAKELVHQSPFNMERGDWSAGGEWIDTSEPRRETLIRRETCAIDKLWLKRAVMMPDPETSWKKIESGEYEYYQPDHSDMLLVKLEWGFKIHDDYDGNGITEINDAGVCAHCERMIENHEFEIAMKKGEGRVIAYHRRHGFDTPEVLEEAIAAKAAADLQERLDLARRNPHTHNPDGSRIFERTDGRIITRDGDDWVSVDPEGCKDHSMQNGWCTEYHMTADMHDKIIETYDSKTGVWIPFKGDA